MQIDDIGPNQSVWPNGRKINKITLALFKITAYICTINQNHEMKPLVETLDPYLFLDPSIILPPVRFRRRNFAGDRFYFTAADDGTLAYYNSVTSVCSKALPKSPFLTNWQISWGSDEKAEEMLQQSADYGTLFHILINRFAQGEVLAGDLEEDVLDFFAKNALKWDLQRTPWLRDSRTGWADRLANDIRCFHAFFVEREVKILASEIILGSPTLGIAGAIDLVAEITFNGKRVRCIVDYKSGRNGFYESHELQLALYREIYNENFPDEPIELIFNFAPTEWRKTPTYKLQNQSNSRFCGKHRAFGTKAAFYLEYAREQGLPTAPKSFRHYTPLSVLNDPNTTFVNSDPKALKLDEPTP